MGLFSSLFGRHKTEPKEDCPHTILLPRWDNVADMGIELKISGFSCQTCHQTFSAGEGRELERRMAERIKQVDGGNP